MSDGIHPNCDNTQLIIAEYQSAQACFIHYDDFRWKSGSMLVAGTIVFWLLFLSESLSIEFCNIAPELQDVIMVLGSLLVIGILSGWILYAHHYRQYYMYKLNRINEIEYKYGMKQHSRLFQNGKLFKKGVLNRSVEEDMLYKIYGPKGHMLDIFIYAITSISGPIILYVTHKLNIVLLYPLIVVALIIADVLWNEYELQLHLESINKRIYSKTHE